MTIIQDTTQDHIEEYRWFITLMTTE